MTETAHQARNATFDGLMSQINTANVLAAHALFASQAEAMSEALQKARHLRDIPACGQDPVSLAARDAFQPKILEILEVHQAHLEEVREAARRLRDAALAYRYTDDDIRDALHPARERFGLPPLK